MSAALRERLNSLYAAFKLGNADFLLNAFDEEIEFISYSPLDVFPFLGHHRGKTAMGEALSAGYAQFEFITYEPVMTVCEAEDAAAAVVFARVIHRQTGRAVQMMIAHFLRFRNGKIVEMREFMDSFRAVEQIIWRKIDLK